MGLPLVPVISAVTPIVLGAFDLYRRRSEARTGFVAEPPGGAAGPRPPEGETALRQRLRELEESDLEQARLLSDLSKQVEGLARAVESQFSASRQREARLVRRANAAIGLALLAAGLALWMSLR